MTLTIRQNGKTVEVPRTVEAEGGAAIEKWVAEETKAKKKTTRRRRRAKAKPASDPEPAPPTEEE